MQLKESHAVVTGGASGLGLAVASRIVQAGGKVTLLDVNEAQGSAAAATLGERAAFIATDVTDESAVNGAIDRARERMGSINTAVNCAGIGDKKEVEFWETPKETWDLVIGVNAPMTPTGAYSSNIKP